MRKRILGLLFEEIGDVGVYGLPTVVSVSVISGEFSIKSKKLRKVFHLMQIGFE